MSHLNIILAEVSTKSPTVGDSQTLEIVIVGFLFVMFVLCALSAVTSTIGAFFARQAAREAAHAAELAAEAAKRAEAAPPVVAPVKTPEGEDPAFVAVIAAAVHSVIGDRAHRIVSIRPGGPGWAQEGRRQIFSSHRVR
jgi:Na+-transporting methylmalonyl-CoA/oxaloacetate decarboxylase gamma subunit